MRLLSAVKYDIISQFRHGFYYAYLFVTILYIVLLRLLPDGIRTSVETLVLFSDPVVLGFYFIGGIVLLEKAQNTLDSLFVTPFRVHEYITSKIISLTLLTVVASFVVAGFTRDSGFAPIPMLIGVTLSSIFFTLLGFAIVVRSKSVNSYLLISPAYTLVFFLPVLDYINIFKTPLFHIIPTYPALVLIDGGGGNLSLFTMLYSITIIIIWIIIAYIWAYQSFYKYIILKIGGGGN
ncbi:ABC transporter permease [Bacillus sp. DX4.1]|uniref:fluoroquinolone export ABC transporter permease subunit n=1 Tax=Bacillus sp. DX4.1 TaxID=3055867 RepID=UPI0025A10C7A|nr:ABC transporter permease [Bacillus sp. DX4.1]MDM5187024.1 ABC transporter permease [Bacillus sp. DX4.1]